MRTFLKQVVDSYYHTRKMNKEGVPVNLFPFSLRVFMLISLPNSVGIDPASANEDVFIAGRLVLPHHVT